MRRIGGIRRKIAVAEAAALVLTLVCPAGVYAERNPQTFPETSEYGDIENLRTGPDEYYIQYGNITVTAKSGGQEVQFTDGEGDHTITDTGIPVITGTSSTHTVLLKTEGNNEVHVMFRDLNIDVHNENKAAVNADCAAVIELDGNNTLKSGRGNAGIVHTGDGGSTLTIRDGAASGMGKLTAVGGSYDTGDEYRDDDINKGAGAGIGGGFGQNGSCITIENVEIEATGGKVHVLRSAGHQLGNDIGGAAGIGGGYLGYGSQITIIGGDVTAYGNDGAAGIGGGIGGNGEEITIEGRAKVSANGHSDSSGVGGGAGIGGGSEASGNQITIENADEVFANSNGEGAVIGGGYKGEGLYITITNTKVTAIGGGGAGIGGGGGGRFGENIVINSGEVYARGGSGIGGGSNGGGGGRDITINGGTVYAFSNGNGAGIGGANDGICERIKITGGTVSACGGDGGAGIGQGYTIDSNRKIYAKDIEITGGTVFVFGGYGAAGIGGGKSDNPYHAFSLGSDIRILGGTITATGGADGAGIGGGNNGYGENITIGGSSTVTAIGGESGAGIGGGHNGNGENITINGSSIVTATGGTFGLLNGRGGAGIGGGCAEDTGGAGEKISIGGSSVVKATGGAEAAGIGGGYKANANDIYIGGESHVTASAGTGAAGIGAGSWCDGDEGENNAHFEISGNALVKVSGGKGEEGVIKPGAAIGYGSSNDTEEGEERSPEPKEESKDRIEFYTPGTGTADMKAGAAAKRIKTPYTVYFRPDRTPTGGEVIPSPRHKTVISDNKYGELPEINSDDGTFAGWYSAEGASGNRVKADTVVKLTENQILYGLWKVDYKIRYDANGGTGEMKDDSRTTGIEKRLTKNVFKKTGHVFAGWNTEADGSGASYSDEEIVDLAMRQGETAVLYAQWNEIKIANDSLPKGKEGEVYNALLETVNSIQNAVWSIKGALPKGLSLINNEDFTGTISGTPGEAGTFPVTVVVSANGEVVEKDFEIEITPAAAKDDRLKKVIELEGLEPKTGNKTYATLYGPKEPVSFNGKTHVWKGEKLSNKKLKKKTADLDIEVTGLPGTVSGSFIYKKTRNASDTKACYFIKLKADKKSASFNALTKKEKKSLKKAVKKANKKLKKKENRFYFPIGKLDISGFVFDKQKSRVNYYVFTGNGDDTLTLQKKTIKHTEVISVLPYIEKKKRSSSLVLYATISGNRTEISKKEYKKTMTSDLVTIIGKDKNLTGTTGS